MRKKGILCLREVVDVSVVMRLLCFSVLCLSGYSSKGMVEENERRALLKLRDSLNYPNGSALIHDWVGDDYCAWKRIYCGVNSSRVVEIFLPWEREEELGIWYPNATIISQFKELESLTLAGNQIGGWVMGEALCGLKNLKYLDLRSNRLDNENLPFCLFYNLPLLEHLDLSANNLKGSSSFLSGICELRNLRELYLRHNQLQGGIHPCFGEMKSLEVLDLSKNQFNGSFPSISNLTSLRILSLRDNSFDGILSFSMLANLSNQHRLASVDLSNNFLQGTVPNNFDKLFPRLKFLNMSQNALEGTIPPSFGNLSNLQTLDLSHNSLRGQIPQRLTQNNTLLQVLILSSNNFHGEIMPRFSDMTNLVYLCLQNNGFTGNVPAGMVNMPNLWVLDVSGNNLSGNLSNWFSALPNLHALILARNIFHGEIPVSLCQKQNLCILDLSANRLSGVLPSCLSNITAWKKETKISYPDWISSQSVSSYYRIKIPFGTKGNSLSFEGAPLSLMTGIDLSSNQLSGEIPSSMGELTMLRSINFSHNDLVGHFPESFQNLENLESLDLSHNRLAGILPPQIVQLHFITTFSVAFNNFSGRIPYEKQFSTFNETSYVGNPGLCGLPLPLKENCSSENPPQHDDQQGKEDKPGIDDSDLFFFSCVAVCFVLGFWAVIAPLILSRNWRRRYYEVVDSCIDLCSEKLFGFWLRVKIYHRN